MPSDLTLITGASGLVGSAVAIQFLKQGHRVRFAFRKASQGSDWTTKYPQYASQIETVVVPDLTADGAFDEAIKDVKLVAHVAAPVHLAPKNPKEDSIDPAIKSNVVLLKAAKESGTVRSVVITSSVVAHYRLDTPPAAGTVVVDQDWAAYTYEEAIKFTEAHGFLTYGAEKTLAERAAWDYIEKEKPSYTLTTISPAAVFGHDFQPSLRTYADVGSASTWGWVAASIIDTPKIPDAPFTQFIDAEDVALAHYGAVTVPKAAGKRYIVAAGRINYEEVARIAAEVVPESAGRFPSTAGGPFSESYTFDGSAAERDFGFKYQTLEESTAKWAKQIFSLPTTA